MGSEESDYFFAVLDFCLASGTEPVEALKQAVESYAMCFTKRHSFNRMERDQSG